MPIEQRSGSRGRPEWVTLITTALAALLFGAGGGYLIGHRAATVTVQAPFPKPTPIGAVQSGNGAPTPAVTAPLGTSIVRDALQIQASGPVVVTKDGGIGPGLEVTFQITMRNTGGPGYVQGPASFGIRCDANRAGRAGDDWSTSTALNQRVAAAQAVTGTAVVAWLAWNSATKCTGPTTLEAQWPGSGLVAWTLPPDIVAQANAADG